MPKVNQQNSSAIDLSDESFNNVTPFSFEVALIRGMIVEVTDWVGPEIGFGKSCFRVRVALTARLWDTLLQAYVRRENGNHQNSSDKRNDIIWLAAQALERAEGMDATQFKVHLPLKSGVERELEVRVEYLDREDRKYSQVVIGFPEDFLRL